MQGPIQQHYIQTTAADVNIYVLPVELILQHVENLKQYSIKNSKNKIKICYFAIVDNLCSFIEVQNKVFFWNNQIKQYEISVIPFQRREQIHEHLEMTKKMGQSSFQIQYVKMIDLLERQIEASIIKQFCLKQFGWSQTKTINFVQKQGIGNLIDFLKYSRFNTLELAKIRKIWVFIQNYNKYS